MEMKMPNWTKVKSAGSGRRATRKTPAVARNRTGSQTASIILPKDMGDNGDRASFYSDGNGKLAVAFGDSGDFSVMRNKSGTARITIPRQYAHKIPFGTTDVFLSADGDMLVLDLSAIGAAA